MTRIGKAQRIKLRMTVRDVIERHGHFAHGGNPDDAAETWTESGFEADEVEE
jgi:hypothetical protein